MENLTRVTVHNYKDIIKTRTQYIGYYDNFSAYDLHYLENSEGEVHNEIELKMFCLIAEDMGIDVSDHTGMIELRVYDTETSAEDTEAMSLIKWINAVAEQSRQQDEQEVSNSQTSEDEIGYATPESNMENWIVPEDSAIYGIYGKEGIG